MAQALAQARLAAAQGEVPVGAVLVRDGQLLASGHNAPVGLHDPTAHAEIQVLRRAAQAARNYRLDGSTLYVTLEPCAMCSAALLQARVARVVFGAAEPKTGAAGSVLDLFALAQLNHHTRVLGGVLAADCAALLQGFFQQRRRSQRQQQLAAMPLRQDALRTPAARFDGLPDYPWPARYVHDLPALAGLRLHYLDEGDKSAPAWVLLHDAQGWSYDGRLVMAALLAAGQRVLALDWVGFGKSDKPKKPSLVDGHSPQWHAQLLQQWHGFLGLGAVYVVGRAPVLPLAAALPRLGVCRFPAQPLQLLQTPPGLAAQAPFPDAGHAAGPRAWRAWPALAPLDAVGSVQERIFDNAEPQDATQARVWTAQAMEYFRV